MRKLVADHPAATAGLAGLALVAFILLSGAGFNAFRIEWDFTRTGQLGDSFGVFSSVMATIAAIFAFRTFQSARHDSAELERRAAEQSFLNLVERRYQVLDRVRHVILVPDGDGHIRKLVTHELVGQAAVDRMAEQLKNLRLERPNEALKTLYDDVVGESFGLPNYFRFSYHIVSYAQRQVGDSNKLGRKSNPAYPQVRLLRAQLSPSELVMIALNAVYDQGRPNFTALIEGFGLLHNMDEAEIVLFNLRDPAAFKDSAFGLPDEEEAQSGDPKAHGAPPAAP